MGDGKASTGEEGVEGRGVHPESTAARKSSWKGRAQPAPCRTLKLEVSLGQAPFQL